jgi:hypothetical protein
MELQNYYGIIEFLYRTTMEEISMVSLSCFLYFKNRAKALKGLPQEPKFTYMQNCQERV